MRVPSRSPGGLKTTAYGGSPLVHLPRCIAYYLAIWTISAPAWCRFAWVLLLVVARLAFEHEVVRVQCDLWVVAVCIVEPCPPVVDYLSKLYSAGLAQSAVDGLSFLYVCITCASPRLRLVELFLIQCVHTSGSIPTTHRSSLSYAGRYSYIVKRRRLFWPRPHNTILNHFY